jgi:hypothetical protein
MEPRVDHEHMKAKNICGRMWFKMDIFRRDCIQLTREEWRDTTAWVPTVPHSIFGVGMPSIRALAIIISKM